MTCFFSILGLSTCKSQETYHNMLHVIIINSVKGTVHEISIIAIWYRSPPCRPVCISVTCSMQVNFPIIPVDMWLFSVSCVELAFAVYSPSQLNK